MPNPYDYNPSILELTKDEMVDQSNLTASQFLIWLGQMVHPDVPLYNMVHTFTIKGALDPDKFLEAFQALLDGSDALRTVIEIVDGVPQQQVRRNFSYPMPYLDFSSNLQAHTAFQKWLKARKVYIFKLETCLFDTVLLKLADQHYVWYLNQHHLIADVLSFSIVYKRMAEFYGLALAGRLEEAPVLPQYQDFIKYQRTYRQSSSFEKAKVYWQEKLAEPFEPTSLYGHTPLPEARPLAQRINLPLGKSRSEKLKKIAQKKEIRALTPDITLFQIFVTLLACYIYRVSGKQHITFGTPFHNRTTASFKETIGLFIHIYPFQLEIADDESFLSLFYKVREESYTFLRYAPLGTSSSEGQKAYNVLLNYINTSFQDFNGLPMEPEWIHPGYGDSHHSLRLQVHDFTACGSFTLFFDFHRDVLSEEQHSWAVQHFLMLLEGFLDDPTQPINRVDILADEERQRLMIETNQTRSIYPNDRTIIELFEAQVSNTPQAIAVVYEDQQLTYAELNRRANQLAHFLQKLGVGPDTLVGVFMERSLEMVISLYGILKAGGAYVPLDPEYPTDRIIFMIEDTEVSVLLTHERLAEKLSKTQNSVSKSQKQKLICLDSEWTTVSQESPVNPANDATAENLAYVIYTSGSTGQPKGVMNEHRGICNRLLWMQDAYSLTAEDRVLQKTPFSFDVSVWEFFWPLLFGARLVVAKPGGHKDCGYLVQLIVEQKITTIHFVPSMLQAFLLDENIETCQSLNRVICSGEALPYALQERFFARLEAELHNLYGPTEAAVDVTYWACQRESELTTVPIGLPVANTQLYLLDSQLQPVPIGMPGELHIGGVQVARGYFNRPGLTAEKFISDPFNTDPDARLYKTGDLARYLPDGNLVYLGRLDHQVKIRGNRIELGEIEATLSQHASVREVVVVAHDYAPGDKRLVAYVALREATPPTMSDWRHFLSQTLPNYMVPSAFVVLNEFPLTHNGKVDRKALPIPELDRSTLSRYFVSPGNATEETLANIWATVLKLEKVGIYDNFFDLGGDSILCIQIVARANQAGLRLEPQQVFEHQTISKLAAVTGDAYRNQAEQGMVTGQVPLTPIQYWFFEQDLSEPNYWNQTIVLSVTADLDLNALERAIQALIQHHDALRLRYKRHRTGWQQMIGDEVDISFVLQHNDLSERTETEYNQDIEQIKAHLQSTPDIKTGDLLRAVYFKLGDDKPGRLLLLIHRLAVDGLSWCILVEDLETAYQQLCQGQSVSLPAKTTSFKQWSTELNTYARSATLQSELDFWLKLVKRPVTVLPLDFSGTSEPTTHASSHTVSAALNVDATRALIQDVPSVYNTQMNDVLLTALIQVLSDWTGGDCFGLYMEGHGREDILADVDVSRTVGWFTTIFPIVLTLEPKSSPGAALRRIKEQLRQIPNHGIGYGLLSYLSQVRNTHSLGELSADVLFNYLGQLERMVPQSSLFQLAQPLTGSFGTQNKRSHRFNVNTYILSEQLHVDWVYSTEQYHAETVQNLADAYARFLESIIEHCASTEAGGYTPSDFPLADLNEDKLSKLADVIKTIDSEKLT